MKMLVTVHLAAKDGVWGRQVLELDDEFPPDKLPMVLASAFDAAHLELKKARVRKASKVR